MHKAKTSSLSIYLPANSSEQASYAATELRHYLSLITGQIIEIKDSLSAPSITLLLDNAMEEDSFSIQGQQGSATIRGSKRGIIYGAYELLEQLGCRFFTATCEKIPSIPDLVLPDFDLFDKPAFEYREHNYYELIKYSRFAVKRRLNGAHHPIQEKHGGHKSYVWFVHSFEKMVDPNVYGKDHPEYFSMYNGERCIIPQKHQLCLSNPDVFNIAVENVRKALQENPGAEIISLSQNDWNKSCECPECRKKDLYYGSASGLLIEFVNKIAETLEAEFPNVTFDTLAYNYSRPIPRHIRPRHNVCVRLCSIEACFAHSFEECDDDRSVILPDGSKTDFITDLRNWGSIHDRLYIWDYTTNFNFYPAPHPNWNVLQKNMQAFHKNHVTGVFEQANGASHGGTDFNELRAYIITKLLWDPYADVQKHIREFTDYYYGDAATFVRAYIAYLCHTAEAENIHVGFLEQTDSPLYAVHHLEHLRGLITRAKETVSQDPLRLWRIGKAELSLRWIELKNKAMVNGQFDPEEMNAFFSDWRAYGLTRIEEWFSPETTYRALLHGYWRGESFYSHWSEEGAEEL
ncbi:MAG: DUF4838 domain-containing protein [Lachnospiraceae bacterium]|nr:DUF4838 domain-containing protein [Lachnospiraceae bacterium]